MVTSAGVVPYSVPTADMLTLDQAQDLVREFAMKYPNASRELLTVVLAWEISTSFLDRRWLKAHMFSDDESDPFLLVKSTSDADGFKHLDRIVDLGELLFNMQEVEGFPGRVRDLATAQSIEALMAELQAAKLLFRQRIPFRFIQPTGGKGRDYDVLITLGNAIVPADMKCKVEGTILSAETIGDSIEIARKQLPPDRPGLIFLKIPESWVIDPQLPYEIQAALGHRLRQTGRIAAVIFHWETWHPLSNGGMAKVVRFRSELSLRCRFMTDQLRKHILRMTKVKKRERWIRLGPIVDAALQP